MENIITDILSNFIMVISLLYIWHSLLKRKVDFKDPRLYITLISIMIISIANYIIVDKFIRIILLTVVFMFFFKILFKESLQKCIITPIFYQLIIMLSESIILLFMTNCLNYDLNSVLTNYISDFLVNIFVAIMSILIVQIKFIRNLYNLILKLTDKIKPLNLMFFCMIAILFLNIFIMSAYYKVPFEYWLVFNIIMILVCFLVIFYSLKTKNSYIEVSDKYDVAIKSLNDYEDMMTKYRIANHENKNLLKAIRVMILNGEEDIPAYIDSIVEEKYNDDEKLLFKMNVIPSGGLRATIYSELLKIKENKIKYNLQIDRNLKTVDLIELDTNTIVDICKIIGVLIDNAIEEVKKLKSKNRNISISLFLDNDELNIKVSNNYSGNIEIDKIYDEGYTTKGDGHGYGLALVKKIVNSNSMFENMTEITKDLFSQILIIKYKHK